MGGGALVVALLMAGPMVTFEWAAPQGALAPDLYEVEFTQEDGDAEILSTEEPRISLTPTLGKAFEIRVRACQALVCGDWSELSQAVSLNRSADFSNDGIVGVPDYRRFGQLMASQAPEGDLNGDSVVGIPDFAEFAEHFNTCVGQIAIGGQDLPAYVECQPGARR